MSRFFSVVIPVVLTVLAGSAEAGNPVKVTHEGWTVTADGEQNVLSIEHDSLGAVMKDIRLNLPGERHLLPLKNWSVEKKGQQQLSMRTVEPRTGWLFELGKNELKIFCTLTTAVLTAEVPASKDRVVARILDP